MKHFKPNAALGIVARASQLVALLNMLCCQKIPSLSCELTSR